MLPTESLTVGVGTKDEHPRAEMRGAQLSRLEQIPLRIEPVFGQGPQNVLEPSAGELGHVLQEDEAGSNLANDSCDRRPEPAIIGDASAAAGGRPGLARESGSDDAHTSKQRSTIEAFQARENRRCIQPPFLDASSQYLGRICLSLDVADRANSSAKSEP